MLSTIIFVIIVITLALILSGLFTMFMASSEDYQKYNGQEETKVPCSMEDYKYCDKALTKNYVK